MNRKRWTMAATALLFGCASGSTTSKPAAPAPSAPPPAAATTPPPPRPVPPPTTAPTTPGMQSTLMGVYTEAQAIAGKDVYSARCQSCHTGEHSSSVFKRKWAGKPVQSLWGIIRQTMPDDDPGGLSDEAYTQIVSYLLKINGLPAGTTTLPADSLALTKIRFDTLTKR